MGISAIILGLTCLALMDTRPGISPEASHLILQTGMQNIAALLEELGLRTQAVYLPASMCGGKSCTLVPLVDNINTMALKEKTLPERLIIHYGMAREDTGILVTTVGNICTGMLETNPVPNPEGIASALTSIVVGRLDMANAVETSMNGTAVSVTIINPRWQKEDVWYYHSLGSPLASIAAAVTSQAFDKPVRITEERPESRKSTFTLEVLS